MPAAFIAFCSLPFAALAIEAGLGSHWGRFVFAALWFGIFAGAAIDQMISRGGGAK